MNPYASPLLLPFMAAVFVAFAVSGTVAALIFAQGRLAAGRQWLVAVWLIGAAAVGLFGYLQYGLRAVLPAAIAVGISVLTIYAFTSRGSRQSSWLLAAARGCVASVAATVLLPVSLLLLVVAFGIDGP